MRVFLLLASVLASWTAELQPIFRLPQERFITSNQFEFQKQRTAILGIAFHAVVTNRWFPGLVPIFAVERKGSLELRRLPPSGQANTTEPFFFALPPEDEHEAGISGRWKCVAKRADGSPAYPDFEVANHGTKVAARFDQETEFRFAFITEGSFVSNRLDLKIENVNDRYRMSGILADQKLSGEWWHVDGAERATWEAARDLPEFKSAAGRIVSLFEWRDSNGAVFYRVDGESKEAGVRAAKPLCRVWLNSDP